MYQLHVQVLLISILRWPASLHDNTPSQECQSCLLSQDTLQKDIQMHKVAEAALVCLPMRPSIVGASPFFHVPPLARMQSTGDNLLAL
jgi:hypothetical protein